MSGITIARPGWTGAKQMPSGFFQNEDGTWSTELRYRGTYAAVWALSPGVGGIQSVEHEEGPWYLLRARFQGQLGNGTRDPDDEVVTTWSLDPARLEKSIYTIPRAAAALRKITDIGERNRVRADLEKLAAGEVISYTPPTSNTGSPAQTTLDWDTWLAARPAAIRAELTALFEALGRGVEAYPIPSVVLTKTQIAPPDASAAPSLTDWNRLWKTSTLLSREGSTIPDVMKAAITAVGARGYWLKEFPGYGQRDGTRVEIVTQWTLADDFDNYVYGNPV